MTPGSAPFDKQKGKELELYKDHLLPYLFLGYVPQTGELGNENRTAIRACQYSPSLFFNLRKLLSCFKPAVIPDA